MAKTFTAKVLSDAVVADEDKGRRGVVVVGARVGHGRALERQVVRREKPAWGQKLGVEMYWQTTN
jgi:hypothetical protein